MRFRFFTYPAVPAFVLAGLYVWLRGAPGTRMHLFAMLSMTTIGVAELVLLAKDLVLGEATRTRVLSHLMIGIGALAVGYSLLAGMALLFFIPGSLLMGMGLLVWQRTWNATHNVSIH